MNTIEHRLTELLERKAEEMVGEPDLVALAERRALRNTEPVVVPLPLVPYAGYRPLLRPNVLLIAAAMAIFIPLIIVAIAKWSAPDSTGESVVAAGGDDAPSWEERKIFPLLAGDELLDSLMYGTFGVPGDDTPRITSAVVGRRTVDRWTDVNSIIVAQPGPSKFDLQGFESEQIVLGGKAVTKYTADDMTWYRWEVDGLAVWINDTPDTDELARNLRVQPDPGDGWPTLDLGVLSDGLQVVAGPEHNGTEPYPGIATDGRPTVGIDIYVRPTLELPVLPTTYEIVDVNGVEGLLGEIDGALLLSWPIEPGAWAALSARGTDADRVIDVARSIEFVGRAEWEDHYGESMDNYRTAPTTTVVPSPDKSVTQ